jgi:hypothetical protein
MDVSHQVSLIRQNVHDPGVEPVLQERDQLRPNPVPGDGNIGVRFVINEWDPGLGKISPQLVPPARQEGPNQ